MDSFQKVFHRKNLNPDLPFMHVCVSRHGVLSYDLKPCHESSMNFTQDFDVKIILAVANLWSNV